MPKEELNKQRQINIVGEKASKCRTDQEKIEFFNSCQEAFFYCSIDSQLSNKGNMPKDLDDAYYVYANMKKLNERELEDLKSLPWREHPAILKIFLFDFCILNGDAYSKYFLNQTNIKKG